MISLTRARLKHNIIFNDTVMTSERPINKFDCVIYIFLILSDQLDIELIIIILSSVTALLFADWCRNIQ